MKIEEKKVVKLWSEQEIKKMVDKIAEQIYECYKENIKRGEELVMVIVLHGGMFFGVDLYRKLEPLFLGNLYLDTLGISTYKNAIEPDQVRILKDLSKSPRRKNILVVEDIVDTGETLHWILQHLKAKKPKSIKVAVLIDKTPKRRKKVKIDFVGFNLEDPLWLVGYGLDYKGRGRGLEFIGYLV